MVDVRKPFPKPSSQAASQRMAATGQRDTTAELRIIDPILYAKGLRYRVDYPVLSKLRRRADVAFIGPKVAVFIDGCFWHGCPEHGTWPKANAKFWREKIEANRKRDRDTDRRLENSGWCVIRIWEHERPEEAVKRVVHAVWSRTKK